MSKVIISISAGKAKAGNPEVTKLRKKIADLKAKKSVLYVEYKKKAAPLVGKIKDLQAELSKLLPKKKSKKPKVTTKSTFPRIPGRRISPKKAK